MSTRDDRHGDEACEGIREELGGYVLGGLEEREVAVVDVHLASCPACRAELDELSGLPDLLELAAETPPRVPPDLRDRVVTSAALEPAEPDRPSSWARLVLTVAAAVLIGVALGAAATVATVAGDPPADDVVALGDSGPDEGLERAIDGEARLRDSPSGVQLQLEARGLQPDPDVAYYHVWLELPSGDRVSAGTVLPDEDGEVDASLTCGGALEDYDALTITAHPYLDAEGDALVRTTLN
ncbi:anti-sigma factor domain-containing protein [Egibacter rhizosphaerae]|uniref:anti-sigma factor domain-containing protein n=1 Tax=Egibacter rhizosphaerae TaxID=1670831 RepID=UPI0013F1579E|nr:anti-sigma factor [Egibacter rhizosphaerae]